MLYPSKYVLVTDNEPCRKDTPSECNKKCVNSESKVHEIDKEIESSVMNCCDGIQKSAAGVLPERVWQDSVMNPAYTNNASVKCEQDKIASTQSENNVENSINAANGIESSSKADPTTWNFADPSHKANCACTR